MPAPHTHGPHFAASPRSKAPSNLKAPQIACKAPSPKPNSGASCTNATVSVLPRTPAVLQSAPRRRRGIGRCRSVTSRRPRCLVNGEKVCKVCKDEAKWLCVAWPTAVSRGWRRGWRRCVFAARTARTLVRQQPCKTRSSSLVVPLISSPGACSAGRSRNKNRMHAKVSSCRHNVLRQVQARFELSANSSDTREGAKDPLETETISGSSRTHRHPAAPSSPSTV